MSGDGGSAFPGLAHTEGHGPMVKDPHGQWVHFSRGMTLRDHFAANALIGLIASPKLLTSESTAIAKAAYTMADAMLAERAKAAP